MILRTMAQDFPSESEENMGNIEKWKDIPGYENLYQASTGGRIRTCEGKTTYTERHGARHWKQRVLKQKVHADKHGRKNARVNLWRDGKEKTWLVSRLVAMTWCNGYSDELTVNHINCNSTDNRAENLEWVTGAENTRKAFEAEIMSQSPVTLVCDGIRLEFHSMQSASIAIGRNHGYIHSCVTNRRKAKDINGKKYDIVVRQAASNFNSKAV